MLLENTYACSFKFHKVLEAVQSKKSLNCFRILSFSIVCVQEIFPLILVTDPSVSKCRTCDYSVTRGLYLEAIVSLTNV